MLPTSAPFQMVQIATSIVVFALIVVEAVWMYFNAENRFWGIPVLVMSGHALAYYGFVMVFTFTSVEPGYNVTRFMTDWSTVLRFHGYFTFLSLEAARLHTLLSLRKKEKGQRINGTSG